MRWHNEALAELACVAMRRTAEANVELEWSEHELAAQLTVCRLSHLDDRLDASVCEVARALGSYEERLAEDALMAARAALVQVHRIAVPTTCGATRSAESIPGMVDAPQHRARKGRLLWA